MNCKDLTRKLRVLGCHEISKFPSGRGTSVPDWGNRDLKEGTIKGILRRLGIGRADFERV
jgi:predicted RNA binding protein YcfA (HicA-like mRNA interferase family)